MHQLTEARGMVRAKHDIGLLVLNGEFKPKLRHYENVMETTELARVRRLAGKKTLVLTHYGRKTGKSHEVTIWRSWALAFTSESAFRLEDLCV